MSIFCITGFSKASTELTERVLLASGMSTHLPLERDPAFDLVRWHERVTSAQQQASSSGFESLEKPNQPSRLWQQLAIDLMVANMNSAHWGWAHTGAVPWLEFWSQLEPEIRFVLVCEDRHSLICRLVEEGQTPESMSGHLARWAQSHQEMLRFHLRNTAKSILVWEADVRTNPSALMQSVQENWQTQLGNPLAQIAPSQAGKQPTALLQHIATQILREHAQTAPLDHELQALLGPSPGTSAPQTIATADFIEVYGQLKDRVDLQLQLALAQQNTEKAQEKTKAETTAKQDALNKLADEQKTSTSLQKQKNELSAAQQDALAKNKALQEKSSLLSAQLLQVQEELKKSTSANQDAQVKIKAETAAKQDALSKLAEEQKTSSALRKRIGDLNAGQQEAFAKNKDLQEESELLLAQLHQVQEELEKYYLQHKDRQIEVQALQDRWLRAVQSHPELLDFEDLQILSESKTELTAHWRINQLQVDGVMKGPFEFNTFVENGVAGLTFTKDDKGHSPIHRWPLIAVKDKQLSVIPVKGQDDPKKRSATILQLGTTDWQLVQVLTDKLIKALGSTSMAQQLGHGQALSEGLKIQRQILEKMPALLRFDAIELFGQQNTGVKSVIGLRLKRADLQGLKADPFEIQIQLNLTADATMSSAHLIFDEKTVANPFENWKQNVKSSAGQAVMALQLGPKGWSSQTWHALSPQDQQWLQNTVRLLPFMLGTLQSQGTQLVKGWSFWGQALPELVNWSKLLVDAPLPTTAATAAEPIMLQPPNAAPVPSKAPRKARSAKGKSAELAQPAVKNKVATKATQEHTAVKFKAAKPVAKAKQAAKVPQKPAPATSKAAKSTAAKPIAAAKSKAAKPAVKVKATDKVAGKAKRRTA